MVLDTPSCSFHHYYGNFGVQGSLYTRPIQGVALWAVVLFLPFAPMLTYLSRVLRILSRSGSRSREVRRESGRTYGKRITDARMPVMKIASIVAELKAERDRLDRAIAALSGGGTGRASGRKRVLSEAARARIAQAQRERWRKFKAAKKG